MDCADVTEFLCPWRIEGVRWWSLFIAAWCCGVLLTTCLYCIQNNSRFPKDFGMPDLEEVNDDDEDDSDSEDEEPALEDGDSDVYDRLLDGWANKKGAGACDKDSQELVRNLQQEGERGAEYSP